MLERIKAYIRLKTYTYFKWHELECAQNWIEELKNNIHEKESEIKRLQNIISKPRFSPLQLDENQESFTSLKLHIKTMDQMIGELRKEYRKKVDDLHGFYRNKIPKKKVKSFETREQELEHHMKNTLKNKKIKK